MTELTNPMPPGIYEGIDEPEYHAHPALSATGMKHLLRSPLHYRQAMDHRVERAAYDTGHAIHTKILGVGAKAIEIPAGLLSKSGSTGTNAARDFIEDARKGGRIPLKAAAIEEVERTAEAVLKNVKARRLLELPGRTELSLFATDSETGVDFRGRLDRLTDSGIPIDLKSTTDVRRHKIRRVVEDFGYEIQSETYRELVHLTTGAEARPMQLIFVEVDPPHEVRVVQLAHVDWIEGGRLKMRAALNIYARAMAANEWPGEDDHTTEIESLEPRPFYLADNEYLKDIA